MSKLPSLWPHFGPQIEDSTFYPSLAQTVTQDGCQSFLLKYTASQGAGPSAILQGLLQPWENLDAQDLA